MDAVQCDDAPRRGFAPRVGRRLALAARIGRWPVHAHRRDADRISDAGADAASDTAAVGTAVAAALGGAELGPQLRAVVGAERGAVVGADG